MDAGIRPSGRFTFVTLDIARAAPRIPPIRSSASESSREVRHRDPSRAGASAGRGGRRGGKADPCVIAAAAGRRRLYSGGGGGGGLAPVRVARVQARVGVRFRVSDREMADPMPKRCEVAVRSGRAAFQARRKRAALALGSRLRGRRVGRRAEQVWIVSWGEQRIGCKHSSVGFGRLPQSRLGSKNVVCMGTNLLIKAKLQSLSEIEWCLVAVVEPTRFYPPWQSITRINPICWTWMFRSHKRTLLFRKSMI